MLLLALLAPAFSADTSTTATSDDGTDTPPSGDAALVVQLDGTVLVDRQLPAGKEVTVTLPDASLLGGSLEAWRGTAGVACATSPSTNAPGYQRVALVRADGGLTGTLAPIVSGAPVCISANVQRAAPSGLWEAYRVQLARDTRAALAGNPGAGPTYALSDCTATAIHTTLQAQAATLQASLPTTMHVQPQQLANRLAGAAGPAMAACEAYNLAFLQLMQARGAPTPGAALTTATGTANALPAVQVGGKYVSFAQALRTGSAAELEAAANALAPLADAGLAEAANWQQHLRATAKKTAAPRTPLRASNPVLLAKGGEYVPWSRYFTDLSLVDPATLGAQADASFGTASSPRPYPFLAVQEAKAYGVAVDAHGQLGTRATALRTAETALYDAVYDALDPATAPVALQSVQLTASGTTAVPLEADKDGSYFSIVFGAGSAAAFGGTRPEAWAVPYIGVDLYFAPIDRQLPVSALDGLPFRRLGLTLAVTAYSPVQEVPNRLEEGLLQDVSMLAGVTYRVGRFTNLTAFVVPYKVAPDNPLAEPYRLSAAAGLAVSFDADIWSGVTSAIDTLGAK